MCSALGRPAVHHQIVQCAVHLISQAVARVQLGVQFACCLPCKGADQSALELVFSEIMLCKRNSGAVLVGGCKMFRCEGMHRNACMQQIT